MYATHDREIVRKLIQILKEAARCISIRTKAFEAGDVDIADYLAGNESQLLKILVGRRRFTGGSTVEGIAKTVNDIARKNSAFAHGEEFLKVGPRILKPRKDLGIDECDPRVILSVARKKRVTLREVEVTAHVICIEACRLFKLACKDRRLAGRIAGIGAGGLWDKR